MARKFLTAIDLNKNELQNGVIQNLGSAPSSPVKGQMYFNSTGGDNTLYWYDGSSWVAAKAPATSGIDQATADARYLQLSGAAPMTGNITMPASASLFFGSAGASATVAGTASALNLSVAGAGGLVRLQTNGTSRLTAGDTTITATVPITLSADPTNGLEAATKQYVDGLITGLAWSGAVRAATTANITLSAPQTIDGVSVIANDRVLVKNQSTASQNGVYLVAAGAWTRATDADASAELVNLAVFVSEGTTQADTAWVCTTNAPITVNTTSLTFVQFAGAGASVPATRTLTGTAPITINGVNTAQDLSADRTIAVNTFGSANSGVVPLSGGGTVNYLRADGSWQTPPNTLGSDGDKGDITVGGTGTTLTIDAATVTLAKMANLAQDQVIGRVTASTGVPETFTVTSAARSVLDDTTVAAMLTTLGGQPLDTDLTTIAGLTATTNNFMVAQSSAWASVTPATVKTILGYPSKYSQATVGGATSQVITHNLNTQSVVVSVYRTLTPWEEVDCDVEHTSVNTITLRFATAPATNEFSVTVIG